MRCGKHFHLPLKEMRSIIMRHLEFEKPDVAQKYKVQERKSQKERHTERERGRQRDRERESEDRELF